MIIFPNCQYHEMVQVSERLKITVDNRTFHEYDRDIRSNPPSDLRGMNASWKNRLRQLL